MSFVLLCARCGESTHAGPCDQVDPTRFDKSSRLLLKACQCATLNRGQTECSRCLSLLELLFVTIPCQPLQEPFGTPKSVIDH
ncbi:MAG TPA: hypothetical protein DCG12_16635 [Planctomycetaceae bacterium]|nr:hypothetical protein [Planctomycetaceae bacterium]